MTDKETHEDGQELCQRCGRRGQDRRTLWMAWGYAMHEMWDVPCDRVQLKGHTYPLE